MDSRKYNAIMAHHHHKWAAEVLGMIENLGNGPDLIDDKKFVELKFAIINPKKGLKDKTNKQKNYPLSWTVNDDQVNYIDQNNGKRGYWGLGFYELNKAVKDIDGKDLNNLENLVVSRELFIVQWNWIYQFEASHTSGSTLISNWSYTLRYPKFNKIPEVKSTYEVKKGEVHITKVCLMKNGLEKKVME